MLGWEGVAVTMMIIWTCIAWVWQAGEGRADDYYSYLRGGRGGDHSY